MEQLVSAHGRMGTALRRPTLRLFKKFKCSRRTTRLSMAARQVDRFGWLQKAARGIFTRRFSIIYAIPRSTPMLLREIDSVSDQNARAASFHQTRSASLRLFGSTSLVIRQPARLLVRICSFSWVRNGFACAEQL